MDDIPKITLKPVQTARPTKKQVTQPVEVIGKSEELPMSRRKKLPVVPLVFLILFLLLAGGAYAAFTQFVVWDDGSEVKTAKSSAYIPAKPAPPVGEIEPETNEEVASSGVKGKITATITGEGGKVLEGAVIRLLNSSGKIIKEVDAGKTGVAVFDGLAAGTYKLEGGKKGEKRVTSQPVSIEDGELKDATLSIFLDTNVSITVTVTKADGTPAADQTFILRKVRSSESPLDYEVTTNNFGLFTKSDISPDDNWLLVQDDQEVAVFSVAPTGKNQTINVQTKSN